MHDLSDDESSDIAIISFKLLLTIVLFYNFVKLFEYLAM